MAGVLEQLCVREKLLICQAVHDVGAQAWDKVSALLDGHPLWTKERRKGFFTEQLCQDAYVELMQDDGNDMTQPIAGTEKPKARVHFKLARKWYMERVKEIHTALMLEDDRFKILASEMEEIRAGKWDDRLDPKLPSPTPEPARASTSTEPEPEPPAAAPPAKTGPGRGRKKAAPPAISTSVPPDEAAEVTGKTTASVEIEATPTTTSGRGRGRGRGGSRGGRGGRKSESSAAPPEPSATPAEDQPAKAESPATVATESVAGDEAESTPEPTSARGRGRKGRGSVVAKDNKRKRTPVGSPSVSTDARKRVKTEDATESGERDKQFKKQISRVHEELTQHGKAAAFRLPVTKRDVAAYPNCILRPMDMKTVKQRITSGAITSIEEYRRDMLQIFANACMFNPTDSSYHQEAVAMAEIMEDQLAVLVSAQFSDV